MKLALLSYSISRAFGGIFEISRRTAQTLSERQQVEVGVFGIEDAFTREDLAQWQPLQPRCFATRGPRAYGFAPALARALDDAQADLAHVQGIWTFPTVAARRWARRHSRPYLVTIHGMLDPWALRSSRWKKTIAGALFENPALRSAACLHVNTIAELESIRAYGLRNPACVIPNGVDLPGPSKDTLPPWAGTVAPDKNVLLYLGRLHPKKGLANLIEAWTSVCRAAPPGARDWALAIAGWDQAGHETQLKAQAESLGVTDSIYFLGPQFGDAKAAAYRHAAAFVLPSFSEGLPMVALEAWAHGLPVVMTPQCNLPEGPTEQAALVVQPTPTAIAQGLSELFQMSPADRRAMGARGRGLIVGKFTWPEVTSRLTEVYRWVLGGGPKPSCVISEPG